MNINKQTVTVFLDDAGRAILEAAAVDGLSDSPGLVVNVVETDDLGIWIRVDRADVKHIVLIRWEYVLSIDIQDRKQVAAGIT